MGTSIADRVIRHQLMREIGWTKELDWLKRDWAGRLRNVLSIEVTSYPCTRLSAFTHNMLQSQFVHTSVTKIIRSH